ncbi:hypothetical protein Cme02nite_65310 [Catellatospora methionotrophica]|uniref:Condensation domain-containing protein n=1 Tax=Catellatospora methionotrophica TaxID=121620 RepID=A0A8J3PIX4_9ACTN|nr:condensation domain-containing protein [Catellatospora methionotrophica]GIG18199.1 hypothetical protein Cme02nite_65310 [Catellatospora methionotrophica]
MTIADTAPAVAGLPAPIPLSFNQQFLSLWDQGDDAGPFGPRYHLAHGWRLRGEIDVDALRRALTALAARHETLRTVLVAQPAGPRVPTVFPPSTPHLEVRDLPGVDPHRREQAVEELLIEIESGVVSSQEPPLIRAVLARFDDTDSVLAILVHHTATDGWSMRVTMRDLAALYARERGLTDAGLPDTPAYREFAAWQQENSAGPVIDDAKGYWRDQLAHAGIYTEPTDRPRSAGLGQETSVYRFAIGKDLIGPALELGRATRSSPFMVLLSAFYVLAHRRIGATDLAVPTFTPGRGEDLEHTVGSFFNFMPMRTDIAGCATFRELVGRTRASCLDAYSYDIPSLFIFGEAPELMAPAMADDRATVVFQAFPFPFLMEGELVGDVEYTEVRQRLLGQPVGSDVPDGMLWTLNVDPAGEVLGSVQFKRALFDEATAAAMVAGYVEALRDTVLDPDAPLRLDAAKA